MCHLLCGCGAAFFFMTFWLAFAALCGGQAHAAQTTTQHMTIKGNAPPPQELTPEVMRKAMEALPGAQGIPGATGSAGADPTGMGLLRSLFSDGSENDGNAPDFSHLPIPGIPAIPKELGEMPVGVVPGILGSSGAASGKGEPGALSAREQELMRRGIVNISLAPARPRLITAPFPTTVASIEVRDGEAVTEGAVLARFDAQDLTRALEAARQKVTAAVERVQQLAEDASPHEKEAAQEALAKSADEVREAEERLKTAEVTAPFAARVTDILAKAGQVVKRGDPILEIAAPGDMEVVAELPSSWIPHLVPGHIVWVLVDETGKSYEAAFTRFGGKVDKEKKTIRAYALFTSEQTALLPGMGGRADFFPKAKK